MTWGHAHTRQGDFFYDLLDRDIGGVLQATGAYGRWEISQAEKYLTKNSHLLVVGAHIGAVAIPLSKVCEDVVAIEANPDTFALLEANVHLNGCRNIRCHEVAAGDRDESLTFVCNTVNSGGSKRMPKVKDIGFFDDNPDIVSVEAVRLDTLLQPGFDVVFMDCEGSEVFAFNGMPRILKQATTLLVEFLPHHLSLVAGVTVAEWVAPLNGFHSLFIPHRGWCGKPFEKPLQEMFDDGTGEPVIVFTKGERR